MNKDLLLKELHSLAQLDRDAVSVYAEALPHVSDAGVKEHFTTFANEHQRHVEELSAAIVRMGGTAPELKVDMMGMVAEWIVSFRSMMGEKGPLHAMHMAETYHNSRYKEAAAWEVGDEALAAQLQTFFVEEQRHLSFVNEKLALKD